MKISELPCEKRFSFEKIEIYLNEQFYQSILYFGSKQENFLRADHLLMASSHVRFLRTHRTIVMLFINIVVYLERQVIQIAKLFQLLWKSESKNLQFKTFSCRKVEPFSLVSSALEKFPAFRC